MSGDERWLTIGDDSGPLRTVRGDHEDNNVGFELLVLEFANGTLTLA